MKLPVIIILVFFLFACRHTELPTGKTIVTSAGRGKSVEVTLSDPTTLMENGVLGLRYFPDEAVILVRRKPTFRMLVTAAISTYLLEGSELHKITSAKEVLAPGGKGSFDNGYAGISGCHRYSDGKLYAFYHAEDQENMGSMPGGIPGYYGSVGAAVSEDDGLTWKKLGQVITSVKPKQWNAYKGQQDKGAGEPGVVMEKRGNYLYLYYSDHSRIDGRGVQICMARADLTQGPPLPGSWYKYYKGKFSEPGLGGRDTVVINGRQLGNDGESLFPHPVYSKELDMYIMIFNISFWREFTESKGLEKSGMYIAFSDNGINWSEPQRLIEDFAIPLLGESFSWMANII
ncbi:MAG: hypothetical protein JW822_04900 [Spirochaetales bacterium]|nr:hypothetical protein [Spirochaetales bacterium]